MRERALIGLARDVAFLLRLFKRRQLNAVTFAYFDDVSKCPDGGTRSPCREILRSRRSRSRSSATDSASGFVSIEGMKRRIQHGNALEILLAKATRRRLFVGHCVLNEVDTGFFEDEGGMSDRFGTVGSHSNADGSERETEKRSPINRHHRLQWVNAYSTMLVASA